MNGPYSEVGDTRQKVSKHRKERKSGLTVLLSAADCVLHQVPVL